MQINAIYLRVSTEIQSCEAQLHELKQFLQLKGISDYKIYQDDDQSGTKRSRPALDQLLNDVKSSKVATVSIVRLDRLGRSLQHLLDIVKLLGSHNVKLYSIKDNIDVSTSQGVLFYQMLGAFAEFERNLISERTKAALALKRSKGEKLGRPSKLDLATKVKVLELRQSNLSMQDIATQCLTSTSTVMRILKNNAKVLKEVADK